MSEERLAGPQPRTARLWGLLAVLLVFGAVGLGALVYGLTQLTSRLPLGLLAVGLGIVVTLLSSLFMIGILYRVDRFRGALGRRVELFE